MKTKKDAPGSVPRLVRDFPLNSVVPVRAWWWPDKRVVKCRVVQHWSTSDDLITVQPIEGNTHQRTVRVGRDFDLPNTEASDRAERAKRK